jgi:hypothetical protein
MSSALVLDPAVDDEARRKLIYDGHIVVYSPRPSTLALCDFADELCRKAFAPLDPEFAQRELPLKRFAEILAELKPQFIHHPESKRLLGAILDDFGCDAEKTYFDLPRLRTSTAGGYLTSGIAYAFHPHRDTWYSAPPSQINWWLPVRAITPSNGLAFHTRYWNEGIKNGSRSYDYYRWIRESRRDAAKHIGVDTREQPHPEEPVELESQIRPIPARGGLILFSAAQLHSSVPNSSDRTRLSIDFRTVHLDDVAGLRGARNVDSECTGTNLRDFLRRSDLARMSDEMAVLYDVEAVESGAALVYDPNQD